MSYTKVPINATLSPKPFKVEISDATLDELRSLVKYSKLAPETYEGSFENRKYGVTNRWIREAKSAWETTFDWRKHESEINSFPNYIAQIKDEDKEFDIHFVTLFSEKQDAIPLILLHGWPGSFLEFLPILSILRKRYTPSTLPYHIIAPSMPGYAFSSPPPLDKDFDTIDVARLFHKLMVGLGFESGYVAQGGDIGSKIARILSVEYESCKAVHLNFCVIQQPPVGVSQDFTPDEQRGIARTNDFKDFGAAYAMEQATRPATLGIALFSSPIALLAWIGEKYLDWTDEDPSLDSILASTTLYWVTETIAKSFYPYRQKSARHDNPAWRITKPFGFSSFPKELCTFPRSWIETTGDLTFFRQHDKGGHFAAVEQAEVLLKDVEDFVAQVWKN